jgi:DNA-binding GntR family transcriptional regulator
MPGLAGRTDPLDSPPSPALPLGDGIAARLREAILAGELHPGERLRQERIAADYGTSRNPVREALRQLESEGLVTLVPHSGARVARPSYDGCIELYRMREDLDALALAESVPRLNDEQIVRLEHLVDLADQSAEGWLEHDRRFHLESFAAAPMPHLLAVIEDLWNRTQQYRRLHAHSFSASDRHVISSEHHLILAAIKRRDVEYAASLQRLHIRRSRLALDKLRGAFVD